MFCDMTCSQVSTRQRIFLNIDSKCPSEGQFFLYSLFSLLFSLPLLIQFLLLYLLHIFNFFSLYTFILLSTQFAFSSFILSFYISHLIRPLYERHCLIHTFPFFTNNSGSSNPLPQQDISPYLFSLILWRQKKNALPNLCT